MSKLMLTFKEFSEIYNLMNVVPINIKDGESHNAYYSRLNACGAKRSRTTLQIIDQAKKDTSSAEKAYEMYKEISRNKNDNKKKNKAEKAEQMKIPEDVMKKAESHTSNTNDTDIVAQIGNVAIEAIKGLMTIYEGRHCK